MKEAGILAAVLGAGAIALLASKRSEASEGDEYLPPLPDEYYGNGAAPAAPGAVPGGNGGGAVAQPSAAPGINSIDSELAVQAYLDCERRGISPLKDINLGRDLQRRLDVFEEMLQTEPAFVQIYPSDLPRISDVSAFQSEANLIFSEYRSQNAALSTAFEIKESAIRIAARTQGAGVCLTPVNDLVHALTRTFQIYLGDGCFGSVPGERVSIGPGSFPQLGRLGLSGVPSAVARFATTNQVAQQVGMLAVDGLRGPCTTRAQYALYYILANAGLGNLAKQISGVNPQNGNVSNVTPRGVASALTRTDTMDRFAVSALELSGTLEFPLLVLPSMRG